MTDRDNWSKTRLFGRIGRPSRSVGAGTPNAGWPSRKEPRRSRLQGKGGQDDASLVGETGWGEDRPDAVRRGRRRELECLALEDRQLLSGAGGNFAAMPHAGGPGHFDRGKMPGSFPGGQGAKAFAAWAKHDGATGSGTGTTHTAPQLSAQAKADIQQLQTDLKTIQSQITPAEKSALDAAEQAVHQAMTTPPSQSASPRCKPTSRPAQVPDPVAGR